VLVCHDALHSIGLPYPNWIADVAVDAPDRQPLRRVPRAEGAVADRREQPDRADRHHDAQAGQSAAEDWQGHTGRRGTATGQPCPALSATELSPGRPMSRSANTKLFVAIARPDHICAAMIRVQIEEK